MLDLYERRGLLDFFLDIVAVPSNMLINKITSGSTRMNQAEIDAWKEHSRLDKFMTIQDLRKTYCRYLGKSVKIRRLVYWRYFAVYVKPGRPRAAGQDDLAGSFTVFDS